MSTTTLDRPEIRQAERQPGVRRQRPWALTGTAQRELLLALLLLLCYGAFYQVPAWNEHSRYDLIVALVEDHTLRIDRYHENTGDKAFHDGHYYSDKAPGTALLGAPIYALIRFGASFVDVARPDPGRTIATLAFAVAGLPTLVLVLLLLRFLRPLVGEWWALALASGYGLGSIAFPFATMLFGHAASTCFVFAAFYTIWRTGASGRARPLLGAGFLAGWAVLTDFPVLAVVGGLLIYAASHDRRAPFLMILGALPPALLLLGHNWLAFGGPFSLGYANLAAGDFAAGMSQGLLGVSPPRLGTLNDLLLGPRGLLRLSPWLALAPLGLLAARRREVRREVALAGVIALAFLLLNAGYYLPFGGWTPGPRFLSSALPFATVLVALAPRAFRPLIVLQLVFSILLCFAATATMPNAPEGVRDPVGDLWLPRLLARDLAQSTAWLRWGLHGAQPLLLLAVAVAIAAVAMYATTRRGRWAPWVTGVGAGVLLGLVLGFTAPSALLPEASRLSLARRGHEATIGDGISLAIVDAGVTPLRAADGRPHAAPWAQLENRGGVTAKTMVIFTVYAPSGEPVWSAWHGDVRWGRGERKRLNVEWSATNVEPGDYRIGVAVTSADGDTTVARLEDIGHIRVRP